MPARLKNPACILLALIMVMGLFGCAGREEEQDDAYAENAGLPGDGGEQGEVYDEYAANLPEGGVELEKYEEAVIETRLQGFLMAYEKMDEAAVQVEGVDDGGPLSIAATLKLAGGESLTGEERDAIMLVIVSAVPNATEEDVTLNIE